MVQPPEIGQPLPLAPPGLIEPLGPGHPAIQRPPNERHPGSTAAAEDRARDRRAEWGHPMDDIEVSRFDLRPEQGPDLPLAPRIGKGIHRMHHRPSPPLPHPQQLRKAIDRARDDLRIDRGEIRALAQSGPLQRVPVAHLRHEMHLATVSRDLVPDRREHRPADKRHAHPFGICRIRNQQDAIPRPRLPQPS